MSLFQTHFFSEALLQQVGVNIILPQPTPAQLASGERPLYKTLFLLHGLSDDHTIWLRRTSIERYVDGLGLAVVMPSVHRSFYQDMQLGTRYWTYISEELPALARHAFPLSTRREDTFAAGLSMGGYGAFRLGLGKPGNYAAVASLSGALDLAQLWRAARSESGGSPLRVREFDAIFGPDQQVPADSDLFTLLESRLEEGVELPRMYQACGTEDFLWEDNLRFRDFAQKRRVDLTWEQGPGAHDWGYWDQTIQDVLRWLNIRTA